MLIRIVKLSFEDEKIQNFLSIFNAHKKKIRNFAGCSHLELLRDKSNTSVFFTYSYWNNEQDLENYRNSDLFKNVWKNTKVLFSNRPEAWSVNRIETIE